jgi:hypothetical protein
MAKGANLHKYGDYGYCTASLSPDILVYNSIFKPLISDKNCISRFITSQQPDRSHSECGCEKINSGHVECGYPLQWEIITF